MALELAHVSKSFGPKKAVDDLSFTIDQPGVLGLIGTNGAGKTTTIRMILGMMGRDAGSITWQGKPMDRNAVRVGYMPEERGIYIKNKVQEQLVYFAMLRGMGRQQALDSANRWLDRLGMQEYAGMQAEKLSKGNQQKVQLIATIVHDPQLIFLDEPFSGLDPINVDVFKGVIDEFLAAGKFIIMSSHQMNTVEQYCRDLVLLDRGRTLLQGNLRHIKAGYGHTNLLVQSDGDIEPLAQGCGLKLLQRRAHEYEYGIQGDEMAHAFLESLVSNKLYPERFEIREPSLHEIFVKRVGEQV